MACKSGYLEEFYEEFEYKFVNFFYQNTLFSYMQGTQKKKLSFIRAMGKEMKETFPDFLNNKLVIAKINKEERKLMAYCVSLEKIIKALLIVRDIQG